jgi:nucleoside 2-deoxyribosyltransferase
MRFYVSGPVVEELKKENLLDAIYLVVESKLSGHQVDLPLRSRDIDKLAPKNFYNAVFNMIKAADGVVAVLAADDKSTPVETTIASMLSKPVCIMEVSSSAPRLMQGLPGVVDVTKIVESKELEPQVGQAIDRMLGSLT